MSRAQRNGDGDGATLDDPFTHAHSLLEQPMNLNRGVNVALRKTARSHLS